MAKKLWKNVTEDEKMKMKQFVINCPPEAAVTCEYAASYLELSPSTLQRWRCQNTDGLAFVKKQGTRLVYYFKRDLQAYLEDSPAYQCTAQYA